MIQSSLKLGESDYLILKHASMACKMQMYFIEYVCNLYNCSILDVINIGVSCTCSIAVFLCNLPERVL